MSGIEVIGFHEDSDPHYSFSNWYRSVFLYAARGYVCVEQYMMFQKVRLGGRDDLGRLILSTDDPARMQELAGPAYFPEYAKVKAVWDKTREHVVYRGVRAKFRQNPILRDELLATGNSLLCECAGKDVTWGVGINYKKGGWENPANWTGANLLGRVLMTVREQIRDEIARTGECTYHDFRDSPPIPEWELPAGVLRRIPQYFAAVQAYAAQIPAGPARNAFYAAPLYETEAKYNAVDPSLPRGGFLDMKQDIYETAARLDFLKTADLPHGSDF